MPTTLRHRRLAAWFALVAALALALMPTLSRALAHSGAGGAALAEICSAHGATLTVVAGDGAEVQSLAGQVLDHCAYCGLAADRHAPLPPAVAGLAPAPAGVSMPACFWQAPQAAWAWRSAQPRAPPSLA